MCLVALRERFQLRLEWPELEKLPLAVQLLPLTFLQFLLFLCELLREYFLLVVKDLEILLGTQELVVEVLGLFLSLNDLCLLGLYHLLELSLLDHDEVVIALLAGELGLEPRQCGTRGLAISLGLHTIRLHPLKLVCELVFLRRKSFDVEDVVRPLFTHSRELLL